MDKAWDIVKRDFFDLISLAIASAIVKTITNILRGQRGRRGGVLAGIVASILQTVWTTATYFVLPAMIIEDLNLKQGLKRATQIIKDNFLLVAVSEIGVGAVTGLLSFVVIVIAVATALAIFIPLSAAAGGAGLVIGAILGGLVFGVAIAFVTVFSTYINTTYHTTMFIWATSMEKAANEGKSADAVPVPVPLAAVLPGLLSLESQPGAPVAQWIGSGIIEKNSTAPVRHHAEWIECGWRQDECTCRPNERTQFINLDALAGW